MQSLDTVEQVDQLLQAPRALIFKHSTRCPISSRAQREVDLFLAENPSSPLYRVLVVERRDVSDYIAELTGVRHASPQVILLESGSAVWRESHFGITKQSLTDRAS